MPWRWQLSDSKIGENSSPSKMRSTNFPLLRALRPLFLLKSVAAAFAALLALGTVSAQTASPAPFTLYVSDTAAGSIVKVGSTGQATTFVSGISDPEGLAFDDQGNLFVANPAGQGGPEIIKVDPAGNKTTFSASGFLQHPVGLAFDRNGTLLCPTKAMRCLRWILPASRPFL